jgi:hypothetical protein
VLLIYICKAYFASGLSLVFLRFSSTFFIKQQSFEGFSPGFHRFRKPARQAVRTLARYALCTDVQHAYVTRKCARMLAKNSDCENPEKNLQNASVSGRKTVET